MVQGVLFLDILPNLADDDTEFALPITLIVLGNPWYRNIFIETCDRAARFDKKSWVRWR